MVRRVFCALALVVVTALVGVAQSANEYLDVFVVKVRPEKRGEFDAIAKKIAEANRQNQGDTWVAMETTYGENNTVTLISQRRNYADIEKGSDAFMGALNKSFGETGAQKLLQDFNNTIVSSRSEVRRRRWDLTGDPPADAAAVAKKIGEAHWVYTITVHVRPGQEPSFEALIKDINAAAKRNNNPGPAPWITELDAGGSGTAFYITWLMKSMGEMHQGTPLPQMLGEEGWQKFLQAIRESEQSSESLINHFLPELSNPLPEISAAAPEFWNPKPKVPGNP
jgi:hypothetical protein